MARVYTDTSADYIDWNGDLALNAALPQQDVNFDGNEHESDVHGIQRLDQSAAEPDRRWRHDEGVWQCPRPRRRVGPR